LALSKSSIPSFSALPIFTHELPFCDAWNKFGSGCIDAGQAAVWLNLPQVRKALHVLNMTQLPQWVICTDLNYDSNIPALYPEPYLSLIQVFTLNIKVDCMPFCNLIMIIFVQCSQNYRVLIFNGDHDACVPINDNELWTSSLGFTPEQTWRPWLVDEVQVAGYVVKYNANFSFASVKGAGHMVPQYRPQEAFAMFQRFLNNEDL
jgi:serine carboxypeptidase-like clade 1